MFETAFDAYSNISYLFKLLCNEMPLTIASKTATRNVFLLYCILSR